MDKPHVFYLVFAQVLQCDIKLVTYLIAGGSRNANATWFCQSLDSRRKVDAITVYV